MNIFITICFSLILSNLCYAEYNRSDWKHWIDSNHDCINTRNEILIKRSLVPVSIKESRKGKCTVLTGLWEDFYYPEKLSVANDIDIDHVIPLKYASEHEGLYWSSKIRETFANDPDNLVITYKKFNRSKGAKSVLEWLPSKREYACRYIKKWLEVKRKYNMKVLKEETELLKIAKCN